MFSIGIFGRRNVGKSALINALTEQNLAIVSKVAGTTTDPVKKSIELLDIGKAVIVDTAGFDDDTELGQQRVDKTKLVLQTIDFAILVLAENRFETLERDWIGDFYNQDIPFIIVHNKCDLMPLRDDLKAIMQSLYACAVIDVSAEKRINLEAIYANIRQCRDAACHVSARTKPKTLVSGLIHTNDVVVLVTPIDSEAPKDRLILPQVQTMRSILDENAVVMTCQTEQLQHTLDTLKTSPALIITDSQVFSEVEKIVPKDSRLTSFSILLARLKGNFETYLKDTPHIANLKDGDKILILESCTHQRSCEDIGRVKLPNLLQKQTGKTFQFDFISGLSALPNDMESYAMVFQCGACMITDKQLHNRLKPFIEKGIPTTNYGMALAWLSGIFERATTIF
ncbi:MAG: [FeFe] hydrogenase H-cluster maturation GTPase HydF [Bacteroidales bacterium]|jgi:[FeFe] hydrogenase H-cluster maturation GTPase HydF|nr:[FeFe] hydrogenase H-cluster maturation GTPase HydF [Bacteroidales bacterium]